MNMASLIQSISIHPQDYLSPAHWHDVCPQNTGTVTSGDQYRKLAPPMVFTAGRTILTSQTSTSSCFQATGWS